MTAHPILHTERLILRVPQPEDYSGYEAHLTNERSRWSGGPLDQPAAWRAFATVIGHWTLRGFGMWSVVSRDTGATVGLVGCWYPLGKPEKELGWVIWPEAEGQGLAFEAAQAAREDAFTRLGWTTAVSYIHHDNFRSVALAERLGAVRDDAADRAKPEDLVFRHPVPGMQP